MRDCATNQRLRPINPMFKYQIVNWSLVWIVSFTLLIQTTHSQVLSPPYLNLAEGRKIHATATCGEGVLEPEWYCKIMGGNWYERAYQSDQLIRGQQCSVCDPKIPDKTHKSDYITDGTERYWQSPPLSRDLSFAKVNLTLDLNQEFHVAYLMLKTATSPRPDVWALERSVDFGKTWKPWQYFAPTRDDCYRYFSNFTMGPITRDDQVICETKFAKIVPLENADITITLLNDRPGSENFETSDVLQEWTKATNIRIRLLRPKTTSPLPEGTPADPSVLRRYYYTISYMNVGGRCVCNGHASTCNFKEQDSSDKLHCQCKHNTCGSQCEYCCPKYVQKRWLPAHPGDPHICERCNCHNHSDDCYYDPEVDAKKLSLDLSGKYSGGGVCRNCLHNTRGINCERCIDGYYRRANEPLNSTDICAPCQCFQPWHNGRCADYTGKCECKPNFAGENCERCAHGFYAHPICKPCECFVNGTRDGQCELNGSKANEIDTDDTYAIDPRISTSGENKKQSQVDLSAMVTKPEVDAPACNCLPNFTGNRCRSCAEGFFDFPNCTACNCERPGSLSNTCNTTTGQCTCRNSFGGRQCEKCDIGYFHYPDCQLCDCDRAGTSGEVCDINSGKCICRPGYSGRRCAKCAPGYFGHPNCVPCNCNPKGSLVNLCSSTGKCTCLSNFDGLKCNKCKPGFYSPDGTCIACNCDPNGSRGVGCNAQGKCTCKDNFEGDKCDRCRKDAYNYPLCERCDCNPAGVSDSFTGCDAYSAGGGGVNSAAAATNTSVITGGRLCECKSRVVGRTCNRCHSLYWNLNKHNDQGCQECQCNVPGTISALGICPHVSGQCECKSHVTGRVCNDCRNGFFSLQAGHHFGCQSCDCSPGGSEHSVCDKVYGQCKCRPKIEGRRCDRPMGFYYYPTLYQFQYELEDAQTPQGSPARYAYDENKFANYSWKGYAVFNDLQPRLQWNIQIDHSSIYRLVLLYVNPTDETINGNLSVVQAGSAANPQIIQIHFPPTGPTPKRLYVQEKVGNQNVLQLTVNRWKANLFVGGDLMIDYVVLLPEQYWSPLPIRSTAQNPCKFNKLPEIGSHCRQYVYPTDLSAAQTLDQQSLTSGFIVSTDEQKELVNTLIQQSSNRINIGNEKLAILNPNKKTIEYEFTSTVQGRHVIILEHHSLLAPEHNAPIKLQVKLNAIEKLELELNAKEEAEEQANLLLKEKSKKGLLVYHPLVTFENNSASLTHCSFSFTCRTLVKSTNDDIAVVRLRRNAQYQLQITPLVYTEKSKPVALNETPESLLLSVHIFPANQFTLDHVRGSIVCVRDHTGNCAQSRFANTQDANKMYLYERPDQSPLSLIPLAKQPKIPPNNISDYILLNSEQLTNVAYGNVSTPRLYSILIHYYQPTHEAFTAESSIQYSNGNVYVGQLPLQFCSALTGCRAQLLTLTGGTLFELSDTFDLALKMPTNHSVCIRQIFLVANDHLTSHVLNPMVVTDSSVDFIQECASDGFYIDPNNSSSFCTRAVFETTVVFNKGALLCRCNMEGSASHDCAKFGGQCKCKPNIIGRTCDACRTGYYGFPNCRPCNCPSTAYCEPTTGMCVCPPRVTGPKCDTCMRLTYGFHPLLGCEECRCDPYGVINNTLQCDLQTGKCPCRKNIAGQRCSKCAAGFYSFPECNLCSCHSGGTTEKVCDDTYGTCYCKQHVIGESCDTCRPDSYHLEESNPVGCTKCWCSGVATSCRPSNYVYSVIGPSEQSVMPGNWSLIKLQFTGSNYKMQENLLATQFKDGKDFDLNQLQFQPITTSSESISNSDDTLDASEQPETTEIRFNGPNLHLFISENSQKEWSVNQTDSQYGLYVKLPQNYTGDKLTSYGGSLSFKIWHKNANTDHGIYASPDILIRSGVTTLLYEQDEQPLSASETHLVRVELLERNFRTVNGKIVSRDAFMMLLSNITEIWMKASYFKYAVHVRLTDVRLQVAVDAFKHKAPAFAIPAPRVEQCICPEGYTGSSCELCASGFYRAQVGPARGYCIPCECNGHSSECDVTTGECFNCAHHTTGAHCEKCVAGYFGNTTKGTETDCLICSCPLPVPSNNFASSCEIDNERAYRSMLTESFDSSESGWKDLEGSLSVTSNFTSGNSYRIQCTCAAGYAGATCELCATGFFGQPALPGGSCERCNCSDNADLSVPGACDPITGACRLCLNNTYGEHCQRCAPGFYGDALINKNCAPCACSKCGTALCDHQTGICTCRPNVIGSACDRCAPDHWGFSSCSGCTPCECGLASLNSQCAEDSGQCQCAPGVTGIHCDRCAPGHWNYTSSGCVSCNCSDKYSIGVGCDQNTGRCQCLRGVIGDRCERCPDRHVFIEGYGCRPCENCVHSLLDETDTLEYQLTEVTNQLGASTSALLSERRLTRVNDTLVKYKTLLSKLINSNFAPTGAELIANETQANALIDVREVNALNLTMDSEVLLQEMQNQLAELISMAKNSSEKRTNINSTVFVLLNDTIGSGMSASKMYQQVIHLQEKLWEQLKWIDSLKHSLASNAEHEIMLRPRAERILTQLHKLSVTPNETQSILNQLNEADYLNNRLTQMQQPWIEFKEEIGKENERLSRFQYLVDDLRNWTKESEQKSVKFEQNNVHLQQAYQDAITYINQLNELNVTLHGLRFKAEESLDQARILLNQQPALDQQLNEKQEQLRTKREQMSQWYNETKKGLEDLQESTVRANIHAIELAKNAQDLRNKFVDSKGNADEALKAANAYQQIVDYIDKAQTQSEQVARALDELRLNNSKLAESTNVKANSFDLRNKALQTETKVQNELSMRLIQANQLIDSLRDQIRIQNNKFNVIRQYLPESDNEGTTSVSVITSNGDEASKISSNALNILDSAGSQLEERIVRLNQMQHFEQRMRTDHEQARSANKSASSYSERLDQVLPELDAKLANVTKVQRWSHEQQGKLGSSLDQLRRNIRLARAAANRISLGAHFTSESYVQLRVPRSLMRSGTYTKLDMQFRTNVSNGLLAFLGTPLSARDAASKGLMFDGNDRNVYSPLSSASASNKRDDYVAIELRQWRPVLLVHVGGGKPLTLVHEQTIQPGNWQRLIVEVIGKHVTLTTKSSEGDKKLSAHIGGTYSVFDLQSSSAQLLLGGVPKHLELPEDIANSQFEGDIQHVRLGDVQLGLWNFEHSAGSRGGADGLLLGASNAGSDNAMQFNGKAYALVKRASQSMATETNFAFLFRTLAEDALLIFVHGKTDYLAVQLHNGHVEIRVDLGTGLVQIQSPTRYNDGAWHRIDLSREYKNIFVRVDAEALGEFQTNGPETFLDVHDSVWLGGYPGHGSANGNRIFDQILLKSPLLGCLKEIQFGNQLIRPNNEAGNELSSGVEFGCSEQVIRELRFEGSNGFAAMRLDRPVSQLSLKFRTSEPNGLLFLAKNANDGLQMALQLQDGQLVWRTGSGDLVRSNKIQSNVNVNVMFNDNRWHYLTATRTERIMRLDVDDRFAFHPERSGNAPASYRFPALNASTEPVYFGGVPAEWNDKLNQWNLVNSFIGCIGDVNLNENFQNFAQAVRKQNVQFDSCARQEETMGVEDEPEVTLPPVEPAKSAPVQKVVYQQAKVDLPSFEQMKSKSSAPSTGAGEVSSTGTTGTITVDPTTSTESTTGTSEPTVTTQSPFDQTKQGCALAIHPSKYFDTRSSSSLRFGLSEHAHLELPLTKDQIVKMEKESSFELWFKTSTGNGLLLFVSDDKHLDYVVLYMIEGRVYFSFNCGSGPANILSQKTYNDQKWHHVIFQRQTQTGKLIVDQTDISTGFSPGATAMLNLQSPIFIGGLAAKQQNVIRSKLKNVGGSFDGCIRHVKINSNQIVSLNSFEVKELVGDCNDEPTETGAYFSGQGLIASREVYRVQTQLQIKMEIKPRNQSGVLLYIGSTKGNSADFLLLELNDGMVRLIVDNGNGPLIAEVGGLQQLNLCDGNWHTIEFVKINNLIVLQFDSFTSGPRMQVTSSKMSTDTDSPIYIGGHPVGLDASEYAHVSNHIPNVWKPLTAFPGNYAGCIRKITLSSKPASTFTEYDFRNAQTNYFIGKVSRTMCPAA